MSSTTENCNLSPSAETLIAELKKYSRYPIGNFTVVARLNGRGRYPRPTGKFDLYPMIWETVEGNPVQCYAPAINKTGWDAERVARYLEKNLLGGHV